MKNEYQIKKEIEETLGVTENSDICYILTRNFYKNKKIISRAIRLGLDGIRVNSNSEFFWGFLGFAYNLNEDFERAIECMGKRVSINPLRPYNWIDLSFAYRTKGDILLSDWMNFNLDLFMLLYIKLDFREPSHDNLLRILNEIRKTP